MARGWESKSVEAQLELSEARRRGPSSGKPLNPDEIELRRKKHLLLLSRTRILNQLEADLNPRHRRMLAGALADLEEKLSQFG